MNSGLSLTTMISKKTKYVHTSGWRGYEEPINAVAGVNDTGTAPDSPCPSDVATRELSEYTRRLRKEGIRYRTMWCGTSNIFCNSKYVLTAPEHQARAKEIAREMASETTLLYPAG
jgi:hypothetical protein